MVSNQSQETKHEKRTSEKAYKEAKLLIYTLSEFFERLDFLVTFLAMKKVTRIPTPRAQRNPHLESAQDCDPKLFELHGYLFQVVSSLYLVIIK